MSTLRDIMQKLVEAQANQSTFRGKLSGSFSELIKYHVDDYQGKLESCSKAMLQYEWAWLRDHIQTLELCIAHPEMSKELGGGLHTEAMLEECHQFRDVLEEMFHRRMLHPNNLSLPINSGEHAWELSQESIKKAWGID